MNDDLQRVWDVVVDTARVDSTIDYVMDAAKAVLAADEELLILRARVGQLLEVIDEVEKRLFDLKLDKALAVINHYKVFSDPRFRAHDNKMP